DDKKLDVGGFFAISEDLSRPDAGLIGLRPYASLVYHQLSSSVLSFRSGRKPIIRAATRELQQGTASFSVGNPDVLDLHGVVEEPAAFALPCVEPVDRAAFIRENLLRSEEHTSELQSPYDLVCRLLLEKKKKRCIKVEACVVGCAI